MSLEGQRPARSAPEAVTGPGAIYVGTNGEGMVVVQFHNPEWWAEFSPGEAHNLATLLNTKALDALGEVCHASNVPFRSLCGADTDDGSRSLSMQRINFSDVETRLAFMKRITCKQCARALSEIMRGLFP